MTTSINGETVELTDAERNDLGLAPTEQATVSSAPLTIRVFRARFESSEEDMDLYDALDERMKAERRSLVRQQWADPDAQIGEPGALQTAIARHLDTLAPDRRVELMHPLST